MQATIVNNYASLWKEPLVHFAIAGGLLFVLYLSVTNRTEADNEPIDSDTIQVGMREVDHLKATWQQLWDREPTSEELARLVEDFIREEALYREAIALHLDQDDLIVRRRMAQKMAFLNNDVAAATLSEETLQAWFERNQSLYKLPATVTFSHVFFGSEQRGDQAAIAAAALLDQLSKEDNPPQRAPERGDRFMTRYDFVNIGPADLGNLFGKEFSASLFVAESGRWAGPFESAYGQHLVFITQKDEPRIPELDEVRTRVEIDWMQAMARQAGKKRVAELIAKYGLTIAPEVKVQLDAEVSFEGLPQ